MINEIKAIDRRLKILILTSDRFPPFRPAAKAIFGEEFTRRGHRVDWLMQAAENATEGGQCRFGNGWAFLAPTQSGNTRLLRLKKYLLDICNDLRVFSLARRHRYDVIQVKDKYVAAVFGLLAARLTGARFCFWLAYPHPEANLYGAKHRLVRYPLIYWFRGRYQSLLLYRLLLPRADHIFVQSEQMRLDIAAKGIDAGRMTPVPGSLSVDSIPYCAKDDPGPEGQTVLYVGTLIRKRRLDFVIRVFAKVVETFPDANLLFVGKGQNPEDEALLLREIEVQNIDPGKVHLVGEVPINEVWKYVERSAVCLSPYYPSFELNSTSPTKLIEYMAMARPVIANEHPEQSLVIAESRAGLCLPWDESAFADGIISILQDPEQAADMGRRGRQWVVQNRTNSLMADAVERDYYAILDARYDGRHVQTNSTRGD